MPQPTFADFRARKEAEDKDDIIKRLKENDVILDGQLDAFKRHAVSYENDKRMGGEERKRRIQNSKSQRRAIEEQYDSMSLHFFAEAAISYIEKYVPTNRCIRVYEAVIPARPSERLNPPSPKPSLYRKIQTPFSASRATRRSIKSNAELIESLVLATGQDAGSAISIRGQITWFDSHYDGRSGMYCLGTGRVSGGRLGRDHMLGDVPNHYVRDRLMDYINTMVDEDKRDDARKAVFFDLTPDEIEQYSALIIEKAERDQPKSDEELIALVAGNKVLRHPSERGRVLHQGILIEQIDKDIDLTPQPGFALRNHYREMLFSSVVTPGLKRAPAEEMRIDVGLDMDKDCDQIRTMIALFANGTEWTVDQFRLALGGIERPKLSSFLKMRGPSKGIDNPIYPLAWEFFKKREMLGYPLPITPDYGSVLQERDGNRGKRPSTDGKNAEPRKKRTRRT
ncbi:hypothetical protein F5Y04DRAFT_47582 [Hypomontagnella monticulosa]|nr:hypothetical protein F5Y04DRAFT_47582 [Hypomontagnella monticulosa]